MKKFFSTDSVAAALTATLGSMIATGLLVTLGLALAGQAPASNPRWYAAMFIPAAALLLHYAHSQRLTSTRTAIICLFVGFLAFLTLLMKTKALIIE